MKTHTILALICLSLFTPSLFGQTPAIPEEARKHFVMGTTLFKDAKTPDDLLKVVSEFKQAAELAPQWPEARYNLALAKESTGDFAGAMADLKIYRQFTLSEEEARKAQDKIYELEAKAGAAAKKQAEKDQIAAAAENKKRETRQVLDQLKGIVGNTEYWWWLGSIGNYMRGGRQGLTMNEFETGGQHWWSWGYYRSKYVFRDDKVFVCTYAYRDLTSNRDVFTDLDPDKADFIGTPNGPRIADMVWEHIPSRDQTGRANNQKQVWVLIDERSGDFYFSDNRPLTNPNRDAVYYYWLYQRK